MDVHVVNAFKYDHDIEFRNTASRQALQHVTEIPVTQEAEAGGCLEKL